MGEEVRFIVLWWLLNVFIGWLAFPAVSRICRVLPDRGYSVCRGIGIVVVTYLVWLLPSFKLLPFGWPLIIASVTALALLSLAAAATARGLTREDLPLSRFLAGEIVFAAAFGFFTWMLWNRPDIYASQLEDFANFGFLQAIHRSDFFPPQDPWFAGDSRPYYYGGHLIVAWMGRIAGVPPEIAFNLGSAGFFALAASLAFGLGYNLTKKVIYGFLCAVFIAFLGYITGLFQLLAWVFNINLFGFAPGEARSLPEWLASFDWGRTIRIIPNTVTFYPYYIMGNADVHPMATSIPFQILLLQFGLLAVRAGTAESRLAQLSRWAAAALCLGFLIFINTWAYPVFFLFLLAVFLVFRLPLRYFLLIAGISILMFLPFILSRAATGFHGIGIVPERTPLYAYLGITGTFWAIIFCLGFSFRQGRGRRLLAGMVSLPVAGAAAWALDMPALLVLVPAATMVFLLLFIDGLEAADRFVLVMVAMGVALSLAAEVTYVRDSYGPPFERYNTIMKLYLMQWVFFGGAAGYALYRLWQLLKGKARAMVLSLAWTLLAASLVHPMASTVAWTSGQSGLLGPGRATLDGLSYLRTAHEGDYEAIRWLNDNVKGDAVILEAPSETKIGVYHSRVASLTGLPGVLGWGPWEVQWGREWEEVTTRAKDAADIYNSPTAGEAVRLIAGYAINYVYIGVVVREDYLPSGLGKFGRAPDYFEKVYDHKGVEIYRVRRSILSSPPAGED
ncbi:MAG: hypothetical protein HYY29_01880 [Chloroflexi bacterium]|nr:hypothetical protein [Chloroflexota bacterium]